MRDDKSGKDWAVFGYTEANKIGVVGSGSGGPKAAAAVLKNDQCAYGFLKITYQVDGA